MKKINRRKKEQGMALVATLFAMVIILVLGVSFIMLSVSESKATMTEKESVMALQVANAGVDIMMNYLSENSTNVWVLDTTYGNTLKQYSESDPNAFRSGKIDEPINVSVQSVSDSKYKLDSTAPDKMFLVKISPDRALTPDGKMIGKIEVVLHHMQLTAMQPPEFVAVSKGTVYYAGGSQPVAVRQVKMRFREKTALDSLQFFQNYRAYDLPGNGVTPPNNNDGSSDAVGIGAKAGDPNASLFSAIFKGAITVDGNSSFATDTAGNIRFYSTNNVKFYGPVSINQSGNLYDETSPDGKIFGGDFSSSQSSKGLPRKAEYMSVDLNGDGKISGSETGQAVALAQDCSGTTADGGSYSKSYFKCGDNEGLGTTSGVVGHSKATDATKWNDQWGVDSDNPSTDPSNNMKVDVPADIEFDGTQLSSKPGFAKFDVEFSKDSEGKGRVTVTKTTAYTNVTTTLLDEAEVSSIKNGVLYFEGGNVEISGECSGQITVVNSESPTREAYKYLVKPYGSSNYITQYANQEVNEELGVNSNYTVPGKIVGSKISSVTQVYSKENSYVAGTDSNSDYIYVSRTNSSLPTRVSNGSLTSSFSRVPPYYVNGRWVWPGESSINNTITNDTVNNQNVGLFSDLDREGSVTITGDIEYANTQTALGIIAKNYLLLNDEKVQSNTTLKVRAVLMSFDHSLQFDDVNMSGKDTWYSAAGMFGKFIFKGSMISQYADCEGKTDGTGYVAHSLEWDQNLRRVLPPNFPRWLVDDNNKDALKEYVVMSYQDMGALKVN